VSAKAGFWFGAAAALAAALPAALRADLSPSVWVALAGAVALVLGPLLAAVLRLRPVPRGLLAIGLGIGFAAWPTAVLLSVLKSSTHHRPLGAVTFAFAAGIVVVAASLAALRLLTWSGAAGDARRARLARRALIAGALIGPLALLVRLVQSAEARTSLFDTSLALGFGALALLVRWPARVSTWAERSGPVVWAAVVVVGFAAAVTTRDAASAASPALLSPFTWLLR
jgi:hypothetical protein